MTKKIFFSIIGVVLFLASCKSVEKKDDTSGKENATKKIARSLMAQLVGDKKSIAVLPFPDSATKKYYKISYYLNDELITAMFKNKDSGVKIFERNQLEQLMKEANFSLSGAVSTDTAVEIGKMIGVQTMAIGTLSVMKDSLRINARLVDIESGEIIAVENGTIVIDANLKAMITPMGGSETVGGKKAQGDSQKSAELKKYTDEFEVTLTSLERKGSKLWANFKVKYTGVEDEKWLGYHSSRIIDSEGNSYDAVNGGVIQTWDGWGGVTCPSGIPVKAKVPYQVGSREFSKLALLEIKLRRSDASFPDKMQFKNLSVK